MRDKLLFEDRLKISECRFGEGTRFNNDPNHLPSEIFNRQSAFNLATLHSSHFLLTALGPWSLIPGRSLVASPWSLVT